MNPDEQIIDQAQDDGQGLPAVSPAQEDQAQNTQQQMPPAPPGAGTPPAAQDVDLIEKTWVEKAKQIVHGTASDPYTQSKHLNLIKADYIKKRYDRDIKVEE